MQAAIYGLSGPVLTEDERSFFHDADPAAYILFKRNCLDPAQVRALTDSLRGLSGRADLPILIDQEGGRVARMQPPEWPKFPCGWAFAELYDKAPSSAIEAARVNARALALMLRSAGVNVDCLPLLDVRRPEADEIIGDRSLGSDPMQVAALGRAVLDGLARAGIAGCIKHMPGHGRACADSHKELPTVEADEAELETDLEPFRTLRNAPIGMTAHVRYTAWDAENPGTLSPVVIKEVIRGRIGFSGLLLTDDIDMEALAGSVPERAERAIAAGCDIVLNCWAKMDDMVGIAERLPVISNMAQKRLDHALSGTEVVQQGSETAHAGAERARLAAKRDALLDLARDVA